MILDPYKASFEEHRDVRAARHAELGPMRGVSTNVVVKKVISVQVHFS